ncbi:MAG: hypothetical protein V3U87_09895 [Methylococcaceae bacterium]
MESVLKKTMEKEDIDALWDMYHPDNSIVAVGQSNNGHLTNLGDEIDSSSIETLALYTGYLLDAQERGQKTSNKL